MSSNSERYTAEGGQVGADLSAMLYGFSVRGTRLPVLAPVAPERRGRRGIP